jgi:hypothetical protein
MILYNRPWCKIHLLKDIPCLHLQWKGFAPSNKFREACNVALEMLEKYKLQTMIADNREAKAIHPDDQAWMTEHWFPRAYDKGYRGSAVLVSENVFRDVAVRHIVNEMDRGKFIVQYFTTLDAAKEWLATFPDQPLNPSSNASQSSGSSPHRNSGYSPSARFRR